MRKASMVCCLLGSLAMVPGAACATTLIDFDVDGLGNPIASNTPITTQYANLGVVFQGFEDGAPLDIAAGVHPDGRPEPSNMLTNCSSATLFCRPGTIADVVSILFASPVSSIAFQFDPLGGGSEVSFAFYDSAGINFYSDRASCCFGTFSGYYYGPLFLGTTISRIDLSPEFEDGVWAMDDLMFDVAPTAPVPEPGTWAMMLLGFGTVGWSLRRGRRKLAAA